MITFATRKSLEKMLQNLFSTWDIPRILSKFFLKKDIKYGKKMVFIYLKTVRYASSAIAETAYCIDSIIVLRNVLKEKRPGRKFNVIHIKRWFY